MDGLMIINKQEGYTSQDVCNVVKKALNIKKVGHCGTLDPFAEGLLIVGYNQGTKILQYLEKSIKTYVATLYLGKKTSTADKCGETIETKDVKKYKKSQIEAILNTFLGKQKQLPPMYSAIKIDGKKLYEYARKNIEVERKYRDIEIYKIKLVNYYDNIIEFEVTCSKGTYIRTLAEDIAAKLDTVGHLIKLVRTKIGNLDLSQSNTIDEIKNQKYNTYDICSMIPFKSYQVYDKMLEDIKNGKRVIFNSNEEFVLFTNENNLPLAIYKKEVNQEYSCCRGFYYESL